MIIRSQCADVGSFELICKDAETITTTSRAELDPSGTIDQDGRKVEGVRSPFCRERKGTALRWRRGEFGGGGGRGVGEGQIEVFGRWGVFCEWC